MTAISSQPPEFDDGPFAAPEAGAPAPAPLRAPTADAALLGATAAAERAAGVDPWLSFDRYLDTLPNTPRATHGNDVSLYVDGPAAFQAMTQAIAGAKLSIDLETFELSGATAGDLAEALIAKAKEGVIVRLVVDEHALSDPRGRAALERLETFARTGAPLAVSIAPEHEIEGIGGVIAGGPGTTPMHDHRKGLVVDGATSFLGGMNWTDEERTGAWHDMHARLAGPAAAQLCDRFMQRWRALNPGRDAPLADDERDGAAADPPPAASPGQTVRLVFHSPGEDENIRNMYLKAINAATKTIRIESPYFTDPPIMYALIQAARRGVKVQCAWPAILGLASVAALYGAGYLEQYRGKKALGPVLFFFNCLPIALVLVVVAANAVLFLVGWELMAVLAFLLVSFEDEREEVRRAALLYLALTHVATSFAIAFFLLLGRGAGSLDFDRILAGPRPGPAEAQLLFALAIVGFGTKAGVWPLHIWLPEAHPAAPTHVSAMMSGVLVKTAIYALIRGITLIGAPRPAFGLVLLALGGVSGVIGVLYALAQHDLKRLLAYHTIENVGVILLGLGTGFLGLAVGARAVAVLGFAGGLLHVLNHGIFKSLLFFGAGSVLQATGTREIERMGGLARALPVTATTFLVGAAAISGLPPFNGFVSEWLVYAGFFRAGREAPLGGAVAAAGAIAALALVGGLAAACFAKAFGVVFLGSARSEAGRGAHECRPTMRAAMAVLAAACLAIGLFPEVAGRVVLPVAADLAGAAPAEARALALPALEPLAAIGRAAPILLAAGLGLALLRKALLAGREVALAPTWGCGYAFPSPRMQYTASSFADPLLKLARTILRPHVLDHPPAGYFPGVAARRTHTDDLADRRAYRPAVRALARALTSLRWLQHGPVQLYLLYLLVTVVGLLLWQFLGASP